MSTLTDAEVTAGVSTRAMAIIKNRRRANLKVEKLDQPVVSPPEPEIFTVKKNWTHALEVVNLNGFSFAIRDTQWYTDSSANVTIINLDRNTLIALIDCATQALSEDPAIPAPAE